MRVVFIRLFLSIFLLFTAISPLVAAPDPKLEKARDYVLYYGAVGERELTELAKYDVVIIDPQAMGASAREKIVRLKKQGCLVIGYLSYMEVADWHRYKDRVPAAWRIRLNGKDWTPWGANYAIDLTNKNWRKLLVELTKSELIDYGCDGAFMDTLADIENPALPENLRSQQLKGLEDLMRELDQAYPNFILIGNWTIGATLPVMAKYADVICWENFQPKFFDKNNNAYSFVTAIKKNLDELQKKYRFKVYALWASPNYYELRDDQAAMAKLAASFGYLSYSCIGDYHSELLPRKNGSPK